MTASRSTRSKSGSIFSPKANRLTNRLFAARTLNPVVPNTAFKDFAIFSKLMITPNSHKRAACDPIWSLQDHRARTATTQEFLHENRQVVKVILRPATRPAVNFGLL